MSEPANHAQFRVEDVPLIVRREIEALAIAPLYEAFVRELGRERADAVIESAVAEMGTAAGEALAAEVPEGTPPLTYYRDVAVSRFSAGDAMEWSRIELDEEAGTLAMDAVRCEFAEMYRRLGLEHLGTLLSCHRDPYLFRGLDSSLALTRTETLMEGCSRCDFRIQSV
ncbi:L-2-amino-thiazoline-4-carboxylic acid hydrolase [uncultured Enorma sp.]|uniref:L-2-amino-thiazoline-4-carboxylic acid hydrolase n=1 Tax=uncultured Enorma sp. TaxID=1714346 RepID=UPI0025EC1A77|nr:L-2-amino-thiazoline-4-carboxylic acid hydrolase [uncultured Enorma sp.]